MNKDKDDTNSVIPKSFTALSKDFCSLGITNNYYRNLRRLFSVGECEKILMSLQDCAIQIEIYEKYKSHRTFKISLVRELSSEKARREAKYIIHNRSLSDAYDIKYNFHPKYNEGLSVPFRLKYNPEAKQYGRCAGIIGENGVGKTTMLGGLIESLVNRRKDEIQEELPLFSSVMAICTTSFDCFAEIRQEKETASLIPYYYFCANQDKDDEFFKIKDSVKEIRERRFQNSELFDFYDKIVIKVLPETQQYEWWYLEKKDDNSEFRISDEVLNKMLKKLSSGQLQLFLLITFIFRKINYDTLLVIDEPEVHLHPKAINVLFKLLLVLLNMFQSYCIVSTHSPLIVREIAGRNVYLMRRNGDEPELGKIGIETLGEDISVLYNEIFGYEENATSLARTIRDFKRRGQSYKDIVGMLSNGSQKLSFSTRMLIKQIVDYEKT